MYFFGGLSTNKAEAKKTLKDHFPSSEVVNDDNLYNYQNIYGIGAAKIDSEDLTLGNRDIGSKEIPSQRPPVHMQNFSGQYGTEAEPALHMQNFPGQNYTWGHEENSFVQGFPMAFRVIPSMQQLRVGQYASQSIQEGYPSQDVDPSQGFPGASFSGHLHGPHRRGRYRHGRGYY